MYAVTTTTLFDNLVTGYAKKHPKLRGDIDMFEKRAALAPKAIGDQIPGLTALPFPVFKARHKDSCHNLGARGGWRIIYDVDDDNMKVRLLFIYHKRELASPSVNFLLDKLRGSINS